MGSNRCLLSWRYFLVFFPGLFLLGAAMPALAAASVPDGLNGWLTVLLIVVVLISGLWIQSISRWNR